MLADGQHGPRVVVGQHHHGPPRHRRGAPGAGGLTEEEPVSRIFTTSVASVYPHYVAKIEKKGRSKAELHQVIEWLTDVDEAALADHLAAGTTFEEFFAAARLNPRASSITGTICGVRIEEIDDPLMRKIRYLDKLVDELAKGRPMEKILRAQPAG
jgi:hypothetical protein